MFFVLMLALITTKGRYRENLLRARKIVCNLARD